ncbi:neuronal acetylcholine receptor subunit alpha-3 isoform X2 [Nematostella vectensis]|uniref:neuronal acetylcholine receptor subunit alpha-3 isoform X2 n=1 Tax=Nematostella vectensis TaxID=45351 RepID=UPI0020774259|nr:neuronal acetylcholine receptor subunit alpha-3 isoform X2 [Nematostella vectensis]
MNTVSLACHPVYLLVALSVVISGVASNASETDLRDKLFGSKKRIVRPVLHPQDAVNVSFSVRLNKLVEVNTKHQLLITDVWVVQKWENPFLVWNESDYGGVHTLHVTFNDVWVPDIVLYNNSGTCTWMSPTTFKSSCKLDITKFPFDSQTCSMTFGSWTYDNRLLSMDLLDKQYSHTERYVENGDWSLRKVETRRYLLNYTCCPHPFSDVTFTFYLDRKPTYHILYLIVPCVVIAALSVVNFLLPPDCGERIGLCITILLAMSVYLLLVSNILPETSDYTPLLGIYYMVTMVLVALCLAATGITLKCHHGRGAPSRLLLWFTGIKSQKPSAPMCVSDVRSISEPDLNRRGSGGPAPTAWESRGYDAADWRENWLQIAERMDKVFLLFFSCAFLATILGTLVLH